MDEEKINELIGVFNDWIVKPVNKTFAIMIKDLQLLDKEVIELKERVSKLEKEKE